MKNITRILLSMALLSLSACSPLVYGKVETPSVTDKESFNGVPGGVDLTRLPLISIPFNVGDIFGFDLSSSEMKDSSLKMNSATLTLTSVSSGTGDFSGITTASFQVTAPDGSRTKVAEYSKGSIGSLSNSNKTINFAVTSDVELFHYLQNKAFAVTVSASGTGPGNLASTWNADVTIDFKVAAQYNAL